MASICTHFTRPACCIIKGNNKVTGKPRAGIEAPQSGTNGRKIVVEIVLEREKQINDIVLLLDIGLHIHDGTDNLLYSLTMQA